MWATADKAPSSWEPSPTTYPDAETPWALFSGLCFCFLKQVFHSPWVMLPLVFRVSRIVQNLE